MKHVALLLDDPQNPYQQLLAREARLAAARHGFQVREPEFAAGSSWTQVEAMNQYLRGEKRADALVAMLAGSQLSKAAFERVLKSGTAVVLLNRIPEWRDELAAAFPNGLLAGVAPDQLASGRIQGEQALRLAPSGGHALLVTGTASSPTAAERRRGFREVVQNRLVVHETDGRWTAQAAEEAVSEWLRLGADRTQVPQVVVCHNDAMAAGARVAFQRQAAAANRPELARVPLVGCDGLAEEGRARVSRRELTATVILPATTPEALQILKRYWEKGQKAAVVRLEVTPYPAMEALRPA